MMQRVMKSWLIPQIGTPADEILPTWLIALLNTRMLRIHGFGGFALTKETETLYAFPGDRVCLMSDQTIQFHRTDASQ